MVGVHRVSGSMAIFPRVKIRMMLGVFVIVDTRHQSRDTGIIAVDNLMDVCN